MHAKTGPCTLSHGTGLRRNNAEAKRQKGCPNPEQPHCKLLPTSTPFTRFPAHFRTNPLLPHSSALLPLTLDCSANLYTEHATWWRAREAIRGFCSGEAYVGQRTKPGNGHKLASRGGVEGCRQLELAGEAARPSLTMTWCSRLKCTKCKRQHPFHKRKKQRVHLKKYLEEQTFWKQLSNSWKTALI